MLAACTPELMRTRSVVKKVRSTPRISGGNRGRYGECKAVTIVCTCGIHACTRIRPISAMHAFASSIDAQGAARAAIRDVAHATQRRLERFGCGTFIPRLRCNWHRQGESNPGPFGLTAMTTSKVAAIEGVEPSTSSFELLALPTELYCGGLDLHSRGTRSSSAAARQRGFANHGRCHERKTLDLRDDRDARAPIEVLRRADLDKRGHIVCGSGAESSPSPFHQHCSRKRECFGTPRSKNSIWSARILRFARMNASYRFGTYGT